MAASLVMSPENSITESPGRSAFLCPKWQLSVPSHFALSGSYYPERPRRAILKDIEDTYYPLW